MNPDQPQIERDPSDTCPMCQNGGRCLKHSVIPSSAELQKYYKVISADEEINAELQQAANSEETEDFASDEERLEYFKKLFKKGGDSEQKAS